LLDDAFAVEHELDSRVVILKQQVLKDAYGNELTTKRGIIPAFLLGDVQLSEVPISFFSGAIGRQKMSVLGGDMLKRFNVILDAQRATLYLAPSALQGVAYRQ